MSARRGSGDSSRRPGRVHVLVGCAGWAIPRLHAGSFPGAGTHLERYARVLTAVEINSSFYRSHSRATYERWAKCVPQSFRFAVKLPREITHARRLKKVTAPLRRFLGEVGGPWTKLGALLVQLPPGLVFDQRVAESFLRVLRRSHRGAVALEPRHPSWFAPGPEKLLKAWRVGRVAADPAVVPSADLPGGWTGITYYRLHGSPDMYYSAYDENFLERLAAAASERRPARGWWCIFNNTAAGAAHGNALALLEALAKPSATRGRGRMISGAIVPGA